MGVSEHVAYDRFPRQGTCLGKTVNVCSHYDASRTIPGKIIRDDTEGDHRCIIQLADGRVVLATECQYQLVDAPGAESAA